jgi:Rrf2 family cysteine metabolism transcriptional repressor
VKISQIAEAQAIPPRFLEVILSQLKQGEFVASRRGNAGGYYLLRDPAGLTVGEVICFVQGPVAPVECTAQGGDKHCPLTEDCIFTTVWDRISKAITDVYDTTTFGDLLEEAERRKAGYTPGYDI